MKAELEQVEIVVKGRVQGVGYRAFVRRQAHVHGLMGWVRNESDGSVCVVAQGPRDAIEAFVDALHRGPAAARVDTVHTHWDDVDGALDGFEIRW